MKSCGCLIWSLLVVLTSLCYCKKEKKNKFVLIKFVWVVSKKKNNSESQALSKQDGIFLH